MLKFTNENLDLIKEVFEDYLVFRQNEDSEDQFKKRVTEINGILKSLHSFTDLCDIKPCDCGRTTFADFNVENFEIEGVGCLCGSRLNMDYSDDVIEDWNNGKRGEY